ncbi:MAG: hypothetical protein F2536_01860 [Actinobacteria bacterium]|uniref:Unannotated protein n=1 Tax=freshwater metagenome TaxID=449393 RepID=A0A6J6BVD5_9ZZZZ|nr:hypothetical protein [Actinomycetota bacterium]
MLTQRKILVSLLSVLLVVATGVPAGAKDFVPEGPSLNGTGKVAFLIQDDRSLPMKYIARDLNGQDEAKLGNQWCRSYTTETCRLEKGVKLNVIASLGKCKADETACVENVKIFRSGEAKANAEFLLETSGKELPANNLGAPIGGGTTIWRAPGITSQAGVDIYAVNVSLFFSIIDGERVVYGDLSSTVSPVSEILDPRYRPGDIGSNDRNGVTWWYHDNGSIPGYDCFATDFGKCWMRANFSDGTRVELEMRLPRSLSGWLHGRLDNTELSITPISNTANRVVVAADPVVVPIMYAVVDQKHKNPIVQEVLDMKTSGGGFNGGIGGLEWKLYGPDWDPTRTLVKHFADQVGDKAVATQTTWRFKTIWANTGNRCLDARGKLIGLVTTNALTYSAGPPRFSNGFLNYATAGLHKLPDGQVALGSYNLIIRSETARCLYGFTNAPVSATITVAGDGDRTIATTTVGEKNGWLKLAANGFTFSEKTIRVRITQKRSTITCVSTTTPVRTRKVTGLSPRCPVGFVKR